MITRKTEIQSGSKIHPLGTPVEVVEIGSPGMPGVLIIHNGMLYLYNAAGDTLIEGGIIQADAILANSITTDKLTVGTKNFTHNIVWTATDADTCSWSSGTIYWPDATSNSINAGNTGNIALTTYIYFDGTTTLKTSTTITDAVSETKRLLAIVEVGGTDGKCIITPINSTGTTIDGSKIVTGLIQSVDAKTYFDLNNGRLVVNDGVTNRVVIGKI
jgi:hypothetical protein